MPKCDFNKVAVLIGGGCYNYDTQKWIYGCCNIEDGAFCDNS